MMTEINNVSDSCCSAPVVESKKLRSLEILKVKKLSDRAQLPKKGSVLAAGFDLCR